MEQLLLFVCNFFMLTLQQTSQTSVRVPVFRFYIQTALTLCEWVNEMHRTVIKRKCDRVSYNLSALETLYVIRLSLDANTLACTHNIFIVLTVMWFYLC